MKMTRRVLALLLALCLTFGNVMPAMATGLEGEETVVTEETTVVVPEVEETEAPADAEEPAAPVADETEAPAEVEETEAPIEETIEQIVDEAISASVLQEGVAYNIKAANGTGTLWFSGTITSGRFDGTYTESEAVSVYVENVTDGFLLYILDGTAKKYICIADKSAGGSFGTDAATATVFEWNAEKATAAVADDANNRAFGCQATSTYANFSAYDLSNDYNWGQYVVAEGGTTEPEPTEPEVTEPEVTEPEVTEPEATEPTPDAPASALQEGVAYNIKAENGTGTLWFNGSITSGRFDGTYTESEAVSVYAENVTGGFLLYILDGAAKKYICIEDKAAGGSFGTDAATATVFEWNAEKATAAVADDANNRAFGCGATSTYANFSAYDLSGSYNWGQYVVAEGGTTEPEPTEPEVTEPEVTEPEATEPTPDVPASALQEGVAYNIKAENGTGTLWFNGSITSGRFDGTYTESEAVSVYAENVTGGFLLYILDGTAKKYICIEDKSAGGSFGTDAATATVFEWNAEKATAAVADDANNRAFGCGATSTYANFSAYDLSGSYNWGQYVVAEGGTTDPTEPTEPVVSEAEIALAAALAAGGTVTLTEDINLVNTLVVPEGITVTLDMAGHSITGVAVLNEAAGLEMGPAPLIQNNGILTITGNGTFTNTTANCVSTAADTVLTIEDGSFNVLGLGSHCVAMGDRSTLNVQGGTFTPVADSSFSHAIWAGVEDVTITITGGTFASSCLDVGDGVEAGACGEVVTITGGTFADDVTMYVADGYEQMANGTVVKMYEADSVLTIAEAIALGKVHAHNTYTEGKYYVTGEITEVYNTKYGNMRIKDEAGNILTVYGTYSADGETRYDALEVKPVAGDTVTVYGIIGQFNGTPQLKEGWITEHVPAPGSELNPIDLTADLLYEEDFAATVTVPAGKTYYYMAYRVGGMEMSINGGEAVACVTDGMMMPYVWSITNDGSEDAEYVIKVSYPVGTQMNPETLYLGSQYTSLAEGNNQGYFYTYTADSDAVLEFSFAEGVAEGAADIAVTNMNTYAQRSIIGDAVDGVASIEVTAGDVLQITVVALPDANWNYPAMDLQWNINYPAGTELNPEMIEFSMDESYTQGYATVTIPAKTTYYFQAYGIGGMELFVNEEAYMLLPEVMGRMPVVFTLTNETEEEATYELRIAYPAGHQMNPAELMVYTEGESWDVAEGQNVASVSEGSWNGYTYRWFAPKAGELTITVSNGRAGWSYSITNLNTYEQTDLHSSYDVPNVNTETITVNAGDEIMIAVNSCGESYSDVTPAGDIHFTASFAPIVGTEENPLQVEWNWNDAWTEATATITVPANTSIFASFTNAGMLLTVNDDEPVMITGNGWMPQVLEFKGAEEGETVYNLKMSSPAGTYDNPAELVIGENSCEIEEDSNGYTYKWIAEADGDLTITMGDNVASWSYVVNNLTAYMYGETYSSNDEVVTASQTIPVAAGDEIQITINTAYDWEAWSSPAGTVTFTADFAIPEGAEGNPIFVQFEMDESYMYGNAFVTVPAYTTYYFQSYGIGGMTLEIATEQAENEGWWIVDRFTLPNVMGRQPVVFSVTNDTAEDKEYGLSVSWAIGSQMSPRYVEWMYGNDSVELAEGDTDGYYYTHTAPVTGPVEFFLNQAFSFETGEDVAADIIVTNMNTYEQKVLSVDGVDGMMYMDVTEGDELQIIVTAQPDENWNYPAAYISWGYNYIEGTETNPAWMEVGKNSVKIEANDEDGYYFIGFMEEPGYVTITMNSSNWEYKVGQVMSIYDEEGYWIGEEFVWSDLQASNAKGAKSLTICPDSGNYYLYVNTANKKAGTVNFTVTHASTQVDMVAGKTATLKFIDPATGKAIAASNANWSIGFMRDAEGKEIPAEEYANYLTIPSAGKLTAAAGIEEEIFAYVFADLKDGNEANGYVVYIRPAATSIQINKGHVEEIYTDNGYMENWVTEEENVTELTYVVNADGYNDVKLNALVGPDAALQDVTWKSSNTKILEVGSYNVWTENGEMQVVYLNHVYNPKTGKVGTGTVTLTATANDGSGVKATVKVNVVLETKELYVYAKNYQWMVGPGKSVNMIAEAYTWYNQAPTNKNVIWDMEIVSVFDYETYEWVPYVPAEGEAPIATINEKGLVKAASSVNKPYELKVTATAEDTGVSGGYTIYVAPLSKTGEIMNVPETYDVTSGEAVQPWANFYDVNGKETMSGYTWNSSNKNVAEFIWVIDSEDEYGNTYGHYELQFTGKTGKVTLTATATDGSRVKATATINVVKVPNTVEMVEEASIAAGKTLTLKATPAFVSYDWENDTPITDYAVSDKNVLWDAKVVEWNEDMWEWVEVEQDIGLKISNGKLSTNAKKITGTEPITVKVTATAKLGVYDPWFEEMNYASATCIVTVYPATKQVDLVKSGEIVSKKTLTVEESNYIVLDAVGAPVGEYIWKSSNEKVAVIENNPDGSVTVRSAGKMGKATITATANDGTKKSAKVTVNFVKAVEEIYFPEDLFLSVAKGKSVNFSKTVVVGPTDASNKKLTWSMEWVEPVADEEGYIVDYVTKGDGIVPKTVATMSNGSVKAVMKNVTDFEYVRITATAADKYGATCEAIVVLAPNAIKGLQLHLVNEDGLPSAENYAKKKYTTTDSQVVLMPVATNAPDDLVASGLTFTSSNKNFEVVWGDMGIVVRPVKDAVNPYGTVKVTLKATDGSNANTNITIVFNQPEA